MDQIDQFIGQLYHLSSQVDAADFRPLEKSTATPTGPENPITRSSMPGTPASANWNLVVCE